MTFTPLCYSFFSDTTQYKNSLQSEEDPRGWRKAIICPIFKRGDPGDVANYHPVNLYSALCQVFKKMVKNALFFSNSDTIPFTVLAWFLSSSRC